MSSLGVFLGSLEKKVFGKGVGPNTTNTRKSGCKSLGKNELRPQEHPKASKS